MACAVESERPQGIGKKDMAVCYKVLPEYPCQNLEFLICERNCKRLCGNDANAGCVLPWIGVQFMCACEFKAPDCTKFYVC